MPHNRILDYLLVGDHLGQLKRIQFNGENTDIQLIQGDEKYGNDNAVVTIRPFLDETQRPLYDTIYDNVNSGKYLVATETSHLHCYDSQSGQYQAIGCNNKLQDKLRLAIPLSHTKVFMFYDKQIDLIDVNLMKNHNRLEFTHYCPYYDHLKPPQGDAGAGGDEPPKKKKKKNQLLAEQKSMIRANVQESYLQLGKPSNVSIKQASLLGSHMAIVGDNITLRLFDIQTKQRVYIAGPPEQDWLGIKPDIYVTGLDWLGGSEMGNKSPTKIVTCSKSDSVVRVYDTKDTGDKPVITVDLKDQTFNEYADTPKFTTVAASQARNGLSQSVVVGSTVGHMIGLDLRFAPQGGKKKNWKSHKHLGNLKGSRGASIRDIKFVAENEGQNKIVSCSLDRYVRVHNFTKSDLAFASRNLERKIFFTTKPNICCAVYKDPPTATSDVDEGDNSGEDVVEEDDDHDGMGGDEDSEEGDSGGFDEDDDSEDEDVEDDDSDDDDDDDDDSDSEEDF